MDNSLSALAKLSLITGSVGLLIWYANRAGRDAARVTDEVTHQHEAEEVTKISQNMAQAQTDKPVCFGALYQRLIKGTA